MTMMNLTEIQVEEVKLLAAMGRSFLDWRNFCKRQTAIGDVKTASTASTTPASRSLIFKG